MVKCCSNGVGKGHHLTPVYTMLLPNRYFNPIVTQHRKRKDGLYDLAIIICKIETLKSHVLRVTFVWSASQRPVTRQTFCPEPAFTLQWRHNGHNSVSNHQPRDCFLIHLFRRRSKKTSASLAFVRGIHRGPVNSPHKCPVTRKMFSFDDLLAPGRCGSKFKHKSSKSLYTVVF